MYKNKLAELKDDLCYELGRVSEFMLDDRGNNKLVLQSFEVVDLLSEDEHFRKIIKEIIYEIENQEK